MSPERRKALTLAVTILGSGIVFLDGTVVNVALPAIQEDLDTGLAAQLWVVEAYLLTLVAVMLMGGSFGDLYGRRRIFSIGLWGFAITSAMCALAPSSEFLIASRALQGIAGALLVPGSLAILTATFSGEARGKAIGAWTAWSGIATVLGPAGGGALIDVLSWRWVFWINVPLIAVTLLLTRRAVEESSDPAACPGVDYTGIALSAIGLGGTVFALIEQPTAGWGAPEVLAPLVIGIACLVGFVVWEGRSRVPMLPLTLFRIRNFAVANLATVAVYAGLYGALTFITLYLQEVAGYSPFEAGLATTPITLMLFLLSPRFGALSAAVGPRLPMGLGPVVAGAGLLLLVRVDQDAAYLTGVLPALVPFGVGLSMTVAPLTTTVLSSVDERRAGIASGISNALSRVAGLVAIAVLGAVISAQFAASLSDRIADDELGPAARSAIAEVEGRPLAGVDLSAVPPEVREALEPAITESSESGFHLGIGIAGGLMILGGLISAIWIRNPEQLEPQPAGGPAPCVEPATAAG